MIKNSFLLIFLIFFAEGWTQASASATVESRATIIDPIRIEKTVDLDFGNVISSYASGSVILTPAGARLAQGVELSNSVPGNVTPAEAVVIHGKNSYSIILPESFELYHQENPNQVLLIDDFTVEPERGELSDILRFGATLHLDGKQAAGFYTNSAGFNVTVSYN